MTPITTHRRIHPDWVGTVTDAEVGAATCTLLTRPEMAADERGLVHGGFVFGLADYAAMVAVNDPNVVLGAAEVRFVAPVRVGERVTAVARASTTAGRKRGVEVVATVDGREVMKGTFTTFVLDRHVLDPAAG
jgi:acyl-coenzyme A thioesterase PaaI-like protein